MNIERAAAALLVFLPLAFNLFSSCLAEPFDYPKILRSPTEDILNRFHTGGVRLKLMWYGFMLTGILLAPLAVLMGQVLAQDSRPSSLRRRWSAFSQPSCSFWGLPVGLSSSPRLPKKGDPENLIGPAGRLSFAESHPIVTGMARITLAGEAEYRSRVGF